MEPTRAEGHAALEIAQDPVHVAVRAVRFSRGNRQVFRDVSCDFLRDRINVILGGSGAGKTTLLRMLGCLLRPEEGSIRVDGSLDLTGLRLAGVREYRRRVGMMFQGGALLDSMTVYDNVALPLREHSRLAEAEIRREVHEVFRSVELKDVDGLLPAELSGGMRKRAALARALILAPDLLLCDEPFSGLDPATLQVVEAMLVDVSRTRGVTMVIASHDVPSTFRMADHMVLIVDGEAISGGPEVFRASRDPRVEAFFAGSRP